MSCPSCGHENPHGANFCGHCGAPLLRDAAPAAAPDPNDHAPDRAPVRVADGRYVVKGYLGEGGRKRVYLAHDTMLDRDVAVGIVKTAGLDEEARMRVRREAQSMARLGDHPHVVTVFDIGEENGESYIVSQYMAGGALEEALEQAPGRRLDLATTLRVADGVTRALEHAHANGVVHRDLKPANVFLTDDGTPKLGDFGLAFSVERSRLTQPGMILGTVAYMAPEQALGQAPDAASDLYSLGAMLYEMVTGRPPFTGEGLLAVISQHQNSEPVAPSWHGPGVPPDLEQLILELLEKSPADRPSAPEVVEKIARVSPATEREGRASDDGNRVESLAEGVFVGREPEIESLKAALEDSSGGHGRLMMLVGEPGI
ncbi:MAG: eukaryotic-like serine/threonine-protein kinase, partial [Thermoleophilaceae bacterium]|nr:eukaryotic-like serine/threonine-protein kinase [Thermoleophilaceae bacterium]